MSYRFGGIAPVLLCLSACATTESQPVTERPNLAGSTWQLVQFQSGDGTTLTPDDRAKYKIEFLPDNAVTVRFDCNRGRGTWKSTGEGQIQFGPLALTRAMCPPGSLHNHFVKQWRYIRSYVVKGGHLFLALQADGGSFEFEPTKGGSPSA